MIDFKTAEEGNKIYGIVQNLLYHMRERITCLQMQEDSARVERELQETFSEFLSATGLSVATDDPTVSAEEYAEAWQLKAEVWQLKNHEEPAAMPVTENEMLEIFDEEKPDTAADTALHNFESDIERLIKAANQETLDMIEEERGLPALDELSPGERNQVEEILNDATPFPGCVEPADRIKDGGTVEPVQAEAADVTDSESGLSDKTSGTFGYVPLDMVFEVTEPKEVDDATMASIFEAPETD